jgi:hypothetical protein
MKICVYDAKTPNSVKNLCVPNTVIERPGLTQLTAVAMYILMSHHMKRHENLISDVMTSDVALRWSDIVY